MVDVVTIVLVFLFFAVSLAIGYLASKKEDAEGYLIANRKLGLFQSVMTLSGSFIGAMTLLVYTAFVFTYGISAMWIFVGFIIGFIIFTFFALHIKKISKDKKFYTMADYFDYRFGRTVAFWIIFVIFIWFFGTLSAQFVGGGKVLSELTGINYYFSAILICFVVLTYLIMGGFKSVVRTDVFQFLALGIIMIIMALVVRTGLQVPLSYFNIFNAGAVNIIAFLLLGIFTPFVMQDSWQRIYAMKDRKVVKKAFVITGFVAFLFSMILTYIGLVAKTIYSNIDPDLAILYSFTQLVPPALVGLVSIAFFAAILSTTDTYLFALGVNFVNDILKVGNDNLKKKIKLIRLSILIIGVLALILALSYNNLVEMTIIFKAIGLTAAPIVVVTWFSNGNKKAIITSLILTTLIILLLAGVGYIKPELSFIGIFGGFIIYGIFVLINKLFFKKSKDIVDNNI